MGETTVARLKFDTVVNNGGLRAGMAQAASEVKTGMGKIGAAMSSSGGFGALAGLAGKLGINAGPVGGLISSMFNPGAFGVTAIGSGLAVFDHLQGTAKGIKQGAQRTGLDAENYQALGNAARKSGVDIGTAEMAVNRMRRQIGDLQAGRPSAAFRDMGMSLKDIQGLGVDKSFEKIAKHITNIKDPMERARIEMEMFGRSGASIEPMLKRIANGGFAGSKSMFDFNNRQVSMMGGQTSIPWLKMFDKSVLTGIDLASGGNGFVGVEDALPKALDKSLTGDSGPRGFGQLALAGTQEAYTASMAWQFGIEDKQTQLMERMAEGIEKMAGGDRE